MKKKIVLLGFLGILLFGIISFNLVLNPSNTNAENIDRMTKLSNQNLGFEERAASLGIDNVQKVEIEKPANKDKKDKIKSIEEMKGYIKEENLKNNGKYESKELMTYKEFLEKYTQFDLNLSIDADRMIWATKTHYPEGFQHKRGFVKNAVITKYYDAETGEFYGYSIASLDPEGNGISMDNHN